MSHFEQRINFEGDIGPHLETVAQDFGLGEFQGHRVIEVGYEDFNLQLTTDRGDYFVKIFAKFRDLADCQRYVSVIEAALDGGVRHPKLFKAASGYLYQPPGTQLQLIVMEWVKGEAVFGSDRPLANDESRELMAQAALINSLTIQPEFTYDSWAISSLVPEWAKWRDIVAPEDQALIEPVLEELSRLDIDSLPKAFVHGDLITTNILRSPRGLFVIDFSVSNVYPRIQELAVIFNDALFDPADATHSAELMHTGLDEYQKHIKLTDEELAALPALIRAGHAMHIVGATKSAAQGEGGTENDYWLNLGRSGLRMNIY